MENIKQIMDLFDSAEKWSAYIELSNYREDLVKYLKSSLCNEIQVLANSKLQDTGWIFEYNRDKLSLNMYPNESRLIAVSIEWEWWNHSDTPWVRHEVA